jgi:DNA-binding transcriptional ArsR family regulator
VRLDQHTGEAIGAVFFALSDDTRRHVVEQLGDGSTVTPSGLAEQLPVTRQAVTKHLAVLDAAGLVTKTRAGRETHYRLQPERLTEAAAWIAAVGRQWDERLARLEELLAERRRAR